MKLIYRLNKRDRLQSNISESSKLGDWTDLSKINNQHYDHNGGRNKMNNYHFAKALFSSALNNSSSRNSLNHGSRNSRVNQRYNSIDYNEGFGDNDYADMNQIYKTQEEVP
jgi:hypothetical protein